MDLNLFAVIGACRADVSVRLSAVMVCLWLRGAGRAGSGTAGVGQGYGIVARCPFRSCGRV